jgi:hypothetical protein
MMMFKIDNEEYNVLVTIDLINKWFVFYFYEYSSQVDDKPEIQKVYFTKEKGIVKESITHYLVKVRNEWIMSAISLGVKNENIIYKIKTKENIVLKDNEQASKCNTLFFNYGIYQGSIKSNKPDGKGMLYLNRGDRYDGEWKGGLKNGEGVSTFSDGDIYKGCFKDDKEHGTGCYIFSNGKHYKGEFRNGYLLYNSKTTKRINYSKDEEKKDRIFFHDSSIKSSLYLEDKYPGITYCDLTDFKNQIVTSVYDEVLEALRKHKKKYDKITYNIEIHGGLKEENPYQRVFFKKDTKFDVTKCFH